MVAELVIVVVSNGIPTNQKHYRAWEDLTNTTGEMDMVEEHRSEWTAEGDPWPSPMRIGG